MASSIQLLRSTIAQERPFPGNLLEGQPAVNLNSTEPGLFFKAADGSLVKFGPAAITSDGSPPNSSPQGPSGNTVGELWLDKSTDPAVLKVYDGTDWIDAGSGGGGGAGSFVRWIYTAIGGETSLSGSSGGVLLDYTPGLEEVFVNGVLITRGSDYSAINGSSITNLSPLTAGDVVTVTSMNPLEVVQLPGQVTLLRWTVLATAGQTVLSGIDSSSQQLVYTAGFEEVYVNGAFLRRGIDYLATNGNSITLSDALSLDDEVTVLAWSPFQVGNISIDTDDIVDQAVTSSKIENGAVTDLQVASDADISSAKLAFLQSGSSADERSIESRLRETLSVLDFIPTSEHAAIKDGTSTFDCTVSIRDAITEALASKRVIFMPAGTYIVTDTIDLLQFTQIFGETISEASRSYGIEPLISTRIKFLPSVPGTTLFRFSGPGTGPSYRRGIALTNLYLQGDHVLGPGNSGIGIDCDNGSRAKIINVAVEGFDTGIRVHRTVMCNFLSLDVIRCQTQCVLYDGGTSTTDVWERCYIHLAPVGVKATGITLSIRFINCIFESLEDYGVDLPSSVYGWEFVNNYFEDVPGVNTNGAAYRVGHSGTNLEQTQLLVRGGTIGGPNGAAFGSALDVKNINSVIFGAATVSRYTNAIKTDSTTRPTSVVCLPFTVITIANIANDLSKLTGSFPSVSSNTPPYAAQRSRFSRLTTTDVRADDDGLSGSITIRGSAVTLGSSTGGSVRPAADNNSSLGLLSRRWTTVYATTPTIVTSDEREKQEIVELNEREKRVALSLKGLIKRFKYKDAVRAKGEKARLHVGVIAQEVVRAFEVEGLNSMDYGIVCHETWEDLTDDEGNKTLKADSRYAIRYEELIMFMLGAL